MERIGNNNHFKSIAQNIKLMGFDPITAGGFTQIPNVTLNDPTLEFGEKLVYAQFLQYAWHHDYCFPSQDKIADNLGCSRSMITKSVTGLEKKGLLTIERRGQGMTNIYTLHARVKTKPKIRKSPS